MRTMLLCEPEALSATHCHTLSQCCPYLCVCCSAIFPSMQDDDQHQNQQSHSQRLLSDCDMLRIAQLELELHRTRAEAEASKVDFELLREVVSLVFVFISQSASHNPTDTSSLIIIIWLSSHTHCKALAAV